MLDKRQRAGVTAAAVLLALWSLLAFARASVWTRDRPVLSPDIPVRMWKLGGPQAEELRSFLAETVTSRVEARSTIVFDSQIENSLDSVSLYGWCRYFLPSQRVVGLANYADPSFESSGTIYLLRYPGNRKRGPGKRFEIVEEDDQGALWRRVEGR